MQILMEGLAPPQTFQKPGWGRGCLGGRGQWAVTSPPPGVQVKPCSTSASLEVETHVQRCMSVESTQVDSLLQTDQGPWG